VPMVCQDCPDRIAYTSSSSDRHTVLHTLCTTPNNNKAKCIPGGTLRVLAGKKRSVFDLLSEDVNTVQWVEIHRQKVQKSFNNFFWHCLF
jgi:hypothetical protein